MSFWDQQFSTAHYKYGTAPNAFLVSQAARVAAGSRVLVPGDGEGRNGVWLAEQGHDVTSIDSSAVGLEKTQSLARSRGVRITTAHADLVAWEPVEASVPTVPVPITQKNDRIAERLRRSARSTSDRVCRGASCRPRFAGQFRATLV